MLTRIRPRLTYSNVVATLALFIVLGGGAYATHTHKLGTQDLQNKAVTAKKIKGGSITPQKIRSNAIRTRHIIGGAITTPLLADGAVTSAKLAAGVAVSGPQGPPGQQGAPGQQGGVGPTFGFVAGEGATPTANPDSPPSETLVTQQTINLPAGGKALVTGHLHEAEVDCSNGDARAGLYVDGAPIDGTRRDFASGTPTRLDFAGLTNDLTAGAHVLGVGFDCPQGDIQGLGQASPNAYAGVLVGG